MKGIVLLMLLVICHSAFSQKTTYFNKAGAIVNKKKADYYTVVLKNEDNTWKMQRYYMSGELIFEGNAQKKDGREKTGVHTYYFKTGVVSKKSVYENDKLVLTESFYKSSALKRKSIYKDGIIATVHEYYDSGQLKNEVYYSDANGNREIKAKSYYPGGQLKRDDMYIDTPVKEGGRYQLQRGICLSENGEEIAHTPFIRMPQFPGGTQKLKEYIAKNVKYPVAAQKTNAQGRVIVKYVVAKNGKITQAKVVRSVDKYLDQEALRVVNSMPDWQPGIQYGEFVKVSYSIPVNFVL